MTSPKFRVILSGNVMPECDRQEVVQGLANLFNAQTSVMENLLKGNSVPLKKQYDKAEAEKICESIRNVGAQCSIEEIVETEIATESTADESPANEPESNEPDLNEPESDEHQSDEHQSSRPQSRQEKHQSLLMGFVGSNTEYYQKQFSKFGDPLRPTFRITWHWEAFFYFFFWALYRKMWLWAGIHIVGAVGLMLWVSPGFIYLVWGFIWPMLANYLYFRAAATATNPAMQGAQDGQHAVAKGGVSKRAVWVGILIILVSTIVISNYVTNRFLAEYGEQIKDVLPGSGTQFRGDGLTLKKVSDTSKLAQTSLILSGLATTFKIFLITDNVRQTRLVDRLNEGGISDGWDNAIRIEQHVDRYVLISAGPDQIFKTDDDVLQPILIP